MSIEGGEGLSRSYARFFAEFLNEESPVRLIRFRTAYLCWFYGTVSTLLTLEAFLGTSLFQIP